MSFLFTNKQDIQWDTAFTSSTVDPSGRARVGTPFVDFSAEFPFTKSVDLWDEVLTGGGTSTLDSNASRIQFQTGTTTGDRVVRQSKEYFRYQPGISSTVNIAFLIDGAEAGNRKRIGFFDTNNGFFVQQDGTDVSITRRTFASGSTVDNNISQANWNIDPMDGTGPSGITLDLTKIQRFVVTFDWYGSGIAKCGFNIDGREVYVHVFKIANTLAEASLGQPILPIRYEIENTSATGSSNSLFQYGSSVIREGGSVAKGIERTFSNEVTAISVPGANFVPLLSIRLKSAFVRAQVTPQNFQIFNTSTKNLYWELVENPSLTNASWQSASDIVEGDVAATAVSGGNVITSGYANQDTVITPDLSNVRLRLGGDINGVSDILTIRARGIGQTVDTLAAISWKELS